MLPDGAVARFAIASHAPRGPRARRRAIVEIQPLADRAELGRLVTREAERLAFAWTPRSGDALWDRWVAIAEGSRLDTALASAGIVPPPDGAVVEIAGAWCARRGAVWVIAPQEEDVRAALARAAVDAVPRTTALGSGRLDGAAGSRAIRALGGELAAGDPRRGALESLARDVSASRELTLDARVESRELVVVVRASP
jgi:hypothetical protein